MRAWLNKVDEKLMKFWEGLEEMIDEMPVEFHRAFYRLLIKQGGLRFFNQLESVIRKDVKIKYNFQSWAWHKDNGYYQG